MRWPTQNQLGTNSVLGSQSLLPHHGASRGASLPNLFQMLMRPVSDPCCCFQSGLQHELESPVHMGLSVCKQVWEPLHWPLMLSSKLRTGAFGYSDPFLYCFFLLRYWHNVGTLIKCCPQSLWWQMDPFIPALFKGGTAGVLWKLGSEMPGVAF